MNLVDEVREHGGYTYAYGWLAHAVRIFLETGDVDRLCEALDAIEKALDDAS